MTITRKGKIGGLPHEIREELNRRLRDGQLAPKILPWLNSLPAVTELLAARWNGDPVSAQNLSEWRAGGYEEWLARQEEKDLVRELSQYAHEIAEKSGSTAADAAADIAGGRLLAAIEKHLTPDAIRDLLSEKPDTLLDLIGKITDLQSEARKKLSVEVDVQKFQRETAELFVKYLRDKQAVALASAPRPDLSALVKHMFGDRPEAKPPHA